MRSLVGITKEGSSCALLPPLPAASAAAPGPVCAGIGSGRMEAGATGAVAAAGGIMVQRWLTASSSQSLSSAAQAAACIEEVPLPGSQEARLAVLYSCCATAPQASLLKVAAELALFSRRAGLADRGLCLQEISSVSVVSCAGPAEGRWRGGNRPDLPAAWLGSLLLMSAVAAVSSLGAGNSKGAVLRLMPHSLSTGAELNAGVAADGVAAEGMRLSGTSGTAASLLLMGVISMGDLMVLVVGDTAAPAQNHKLKYWLWGHR